ncbi:tyrosine-type recombinase/integrase [Metabacillus malikii]|uniref:Site-specific recombinase XerD n=1 Tax=Metabacillus malikii TaxID=1504265 RepID=A0ABT9ZLL6_9BACI|nr:tyrosine-type recombinase/integrase [Metabacillus malikii]MDQ0233162.1 site-specific recombinase XerD [Metabacillus malikii]
MDHYERKIELFFELKGTPDSSQESYRRRILAFLGYMNKCNRPISEMNEHDIQQYILHLKKENGLAASTINNYISSIKFFYTYILEKDWNSRKVPRMKRIQTFPMVPSRDEVFSLLDTTKNLKHKAILVLMYGSGLRVSEVARLKISDICSKSMRVRIENAKHNTNRYTILSKFALEILRDYFRLYFTPGEYCSSDWLFPGQSKQNHIHVKTIKNTIIKLRDSVGLDSKISAHTLRHCFATHALEDGVEPVFIQQMLGHKRLQTTLTYLHITSKSLMGVQSPLDRQGGPMG